MCGLEVHSIVVHYKGSRWDLELSLVTEVRFTMNIVSLDCKSPSYSETITSGLIRSSLQWDFEVCGLEVHSIVVHYKGSLWDSELSLVTKVRFTMNMVILDCKSLSYSETVTLGFIRSSLLMCFL